MKTAYSITDNNITLYTKGRVLSADKTHRFFGQILDRIRAKNLSGIESLFNVGDAIVAAINNPKITIENGEVKWAGEAINNQLCAKILEFYDAGLDTAPLCNFLDKLLENPSKDSVDQLWSYIERYKFPITPEGNFLALKAVGPAPDYWDIHSGNTHQNKPGSIISMRRSLCVEEKRACAGAGLHCGNLSYVLGYGTGNSDNRIVLVEVNPKDVVSCPIDESYQKLRVCEYKVLEDWGTVEQVKQNNKSFGDAPASVPVKVTPAKKQKRDKFGRFNSNKRPTAAPKRNRLGRFI